MQFWTVSFCLRTKVSQTLQSVLCITTNKYLVRVLLHARFSVVGPIPFLLAAFFFRVIPIRTCRYTERYYIRSSGKAVKVMMAKPIINPEKVNNITIIIVSVVIWLLFCRYGISDLSRRGASLHSAKNLHSLQQTSIH